jgi:hypothetical protein
MKFTLEMECNNKINFLDITIQKTKQNLSVRIYWKPTAMDVIIPNSSCHPYEQKIAAIRFLANCIVTYPMNDEYKREENLTTKQILSDNQYNTKILDGTLDKIAKTNKKRESAEQEQEDTNTTTKWAKFTYVEIENKIHHKIIQEDKHKNSIYY